MKGPSPFHKEVILLLRQFESPLMLLLIGAVILSAFLRDLSDVFIILFIVVATGLLSFFEERGANRVVEKLKSIIAIQSTVFRDGQAVEIRATEIVPGDVIEFNAGDVIPADCLILESNELMANEASLTGESYPAYKQSGVVAADTALSKRSNCLWEGTNIVTGTAKALVIQTGRETLFGHIIQSTTTEVESTFERGIRKFGLLLMKITLALAIFILTVNLLNHKSLIDSALFALALAVGMAPELLPAITTIAMSAGANRMLHKKVIVKKLSSIQNLGEINLLCTDKTGTITEGTIQVKEMVDASGQANDFVRNLAIWNASIQSGYSNPIDSALQQLHSSENVLPKKIGEIPYDFNRKRLSVVLNTGSENIMISKGAFRDIIKICSRVRNEDGSISPLLPEMASIEMLFEKYGLDGLRAIGICYKPFSKPTPVKGDESEMIFAGFVLLADPVKSGIRDAISDLKKLNIGLKIITGDNKIIATSTGQLIGLEQPIVITGSEWNNFTEEEAIAKARTAHIFAEIEPQQKEHIIIALRKSFSVGYMGDGINDVSALNAADVGISVHNAVDIARDAADFILLEKDLSVLADGIKEGRKTFANTMKYIFISTGSTFGNMVSVAFASLLLPFLPMLPKQLLLTNFMTDFPFLSIPSDNVDSDQLEKPGKWNLNLIRNYMLVFGIHSSLFDILTFITLLYFLKSTESGFQTGWFIESILTELFILFIIRTRRNFFRSRPGKYITLLGLIAFLATVGLPYLPFAHTIGLIPLPWHQLVIILGIVLAYILTADLVKIWFFRKFEGTE